jgi:hypothetical protein
MFLKNLKFLKYHLFRLNLMFTEEPDVPLEPDVPEEH